jgi:serine protease Do
MKRILTSLSIAAMVTVLMMPAVANAQKEDKTKEKEEKEKSKEDKEKRVRKESEQIIITHKGDKDEKVVLEFKDGKVIVNGKPVDEYKDDDVTIHQNRIRDLRSYNGTMTFGDNMTLFNEDGNRAMLGVTTDKADKGAEIQEISKASAAEKAGLKEGDVITRVNDTKIEDADDLSKAIKSHKPGEKVTITYLRNDKEQKMTVELGKWKGVNFDFKNDMNFEMPNVEAFPKMAPGIRGNGVQWYGGAPKLGLSVQDTDDGKGVKVIEVDEESNAAKAGVKEDDVITHVNDKEVNSTDEIAKIVRESKEKNSLMLKLTRGGKTQNIEVKMPRKIKTADL